MATTRVFVTGSTGLLGNNLVRQLLERGFAVRALARSRAKADQQFATVPRGTAAGQLEIVEGDLANVTAFAPALGDVEVLYHTAAYFRDSYAGGSHKAGLEAINVDGTTMLFEAAYAAGIRRAIHTSSIAVLNGPVGTLVNEQMLRHEVDADDYYRSKMLSDAAVFAVLARHSDLHISFVLPGWMFGPGDAGPTAAGQTMLDFMHRKLPGIVPGSFSVVDARDVASAMIAAAAHGRRGERYLAAGRHMTMDNLLPALAKATGVPAPTRRIPLGMLFVIARISEVVSRFTRRPVLLSLATVRILARENGRSRFDHAKSERELGVTFRALSETLRDTADWFRAQQRIAA